MKDQLRHFYQSLLMQGMEKTKAPESWLEAFYLLEAFLMIKDDGKSRMLIFLDEIQWLDTPKSGFMMGLEAFWNGWACHRRNVMVIVCGSSTSWILDKLINNHGGLYDRVTCQICLEPFTLHECELFFNANGVVMSRFDVAQAYMAVGGIPYYLGYFQRRLSLAQNIDALFFAENAPLRDEFDRLFSSLFANPDIMRTIVRAVGTKNRGLTRKELIAKTGIADGGELSQCLSALSAGSFIMRYCSFGNSKREEFYKLTDPFCLFWLRFVDESTGKKVEWLNLLETGSVIAWRGYAFENACWNHIPQIKAALGISGVSTSESLWSKRGAEDQQGSQIDLIISRKDNVVNMCEIKFCTGEFTATREMHLTLVRREQMLREMIPKRAVVHSTLITTFGLKRTEHFSDFVQLVTLDDLFAF